MGFGSRRPNRRGYGEVPTKDLERTTRYHKPIVGLSGGVGAGKTLVAAMMEELGAGIIGSDAIGHAEINAREVKEALCRWWGKDVLLEDGTVNRRKVASIVFRDPAQRHRLEALLHPRIAVRRADMVAEFERQPRIKMVVLDSPLLYEADLDLGCDAVVFIDTTFETRRSRSEKARNWSEEEHKRREKSQQPLDRKQLGTYTKMI